MSDSHFLISPLGSVHFIWICTELLILFQNHLIIISAFWFSLSIASFCLLFRLDLLQIKGEKKFCLLTLAFYWVEKNKKEKKIITDLILHILCASLNTLRHFFQHFERESKKKLGNFNYKHQHRVDGIINKYQ